MAATSQVLVISTPATTPGDRRLAIRCDFELRRFSAESALVPRSCQMEPQRLAKGINVALKTFLSCRSSNKPRSEDSLRRILQIA
jgi:hypothetical protein